MDLRDFSEIGQQIENTVKNAIDSMNFDQLNQNIHKTFDDAFGSSKGSPYDAQDDIKHRYHYDRNHNRQGHSILLSSEKSIPADKSAAGRLPADEPPSDKRLPIYPQTGRHILMSAEKIMFTAKRRRLMR